MTDKFNPDWNPHYDFSDPRNLAEIKTVDGYAIASDIEAYQSGDVIDSPWGSNQVTSVKTEEGVEYCIKRIVVKPGYMLSLQRHRGREEMWAVEQGVLTVICNGDRIDVPAGQSIILPQGAVHCMINSGAEPVTVVETQKGACREKDNIRLLDFNNRPTYPLTSEVEYRSARLYAQIHADHIRRFGFALEPMTVFLDDGGRHE